MEQIKQINPTNRAVGKRTGKRGGGRDGIQFFPLYRGAKTGGIQENGSVMR